MDHCFDITYIYSAVDILCQYHLLHPMEEQDLKLECYSSEFGYSTHRVLEFFMDMIAQGVVTTDWAKVIYFVVNLHGLDALFTCKYRELVIEIPGM